jgi:CPA2 family monovalent cation:H+ antiporter-2
LLHGASEFLEAIAIVLCVAAVTTVVFQRLRQPVVLGYIVAGLIMGPHVPVPLVADGDIVQTLSELGVILLMFALGLEFSLRKLVEVGPTAGVTAVVQCSVMVWLGFTVGKLFGWTTLESIFVGAIIAISSTTIIAKAFEERGIRGRLHELVVGVLVVEDLIAILLMATLTAIASGRGLSASGLALTFARLLAFLVGVLVVGLLVVPRAMRAVVRLGRPETTLIASVGICFAVALLAQALGYSVALGAFLAGLLVAESGHAEEIGRVVRPVRDVFAAIFFVSVGMLIDPRLIAQHWVAITVLTMVVVVGKVASVAMGAFLTGNGTRTSVQAGMSMAQIGEFSFILAGLGLSLQATGDFLYPVAVAVSVLSTLATPWLIRAAGPAATCVDRKLPGRIQTFAALYGSWIEQLRSARRGTSAGARIRRMIRLLGVDAVLVAAIIIGTSIWEDAAAAWICRRTRLSVHLANWLVVCAAAVAASPLLVGIVGMVRRLGTTLGRIALPEGQAGAVDLSAAPRRALIVSIQLAIVLVVGGALMAVTQPVLPSFAAVGCVVVVVLVLGVALWRSAANLHGHARAGAEAIVEFLAAQSHADRKQRGPSAPAPLQHLLPGLGEPVVVSIDSMSPVAGRTLAQINLRALTGAILLAISRQGAAIILPKAREVLRPGDVLALAGTHEAIANATQLLAAKRASNPGPARQGDAS